MYNWVSKNYGKDLIYETRLNLIKRLKLDITKVSSKMYHYILEAELGIILN